MPDSESPKPVDGESPRARRASVRVARHSATEKRRAEKAAARAYAASKRQSARHKVAADSGNSRGNDTTAELPVVEDVPSGGAVSGQSAGHDDTDPVVARRLDEERQAAEGTQAEPDVADASVEKAETQAVEEQQAGAERQDRVRQDAEQAQAEQVEASRIEAERQGLERAEAERVATADDELPQPDKAREDNDQPEAVIDEPRALAAPKTKSVATKVPVKTAGELAAEADRWDADRARADEAEVSAAPESSRKVEAVAKSKPERPKKAPKPPKVKKEKAPKPPKTPKPPRDRSANNNRNWRIAAGTVGTLGLLFSVILAAGALLIALGANQGSGFVGSIADLCNFLVGPLSELFTFGGRNADTKQALVSWGLGSMIYLLASRIIESLLLRRVG